MRPMPRSRRLLPYSLVLIGFGLLSTMQVLAKDHAVKCPKVMVHSVDRSKHLGWEVYSNRPLRLTGADIAYVVDDHYDATLDPDETKRLNDDNLSTVQFFHLAKHRANKSFSLVCHYGVHAQLSRAIPRNLLECSVVHHERFDDANEGEFEAVCK